LIDAFTLSRGKGLRMSVEAKRKLSQEKVEGRNGKRGRGKPENAP
jgi:hypothetical protein